jgi:hypothetical protein
MVTASQLNRSAVEEVEFDHSHISGGIYKINTADNVFGIFTSRAMRERGKYQIQLMKTRSSSGVGQKIDLDFDIDTLRITDPGEDEYQSNAGQNTPSQIYNQIKQKSSVSAETPTASSSQPWERAKPKDGIDPLDGIPVSKPKANVESSKLRQLLNNIGTDEI